MTLIASTTTNGINFLLGDILITSNVKGDESKLPKYLRGIETHFPGQEILPVLFRQKIYIIHERLCIGFAGDLYYIKLLLEDMRTYFLYNSPSIQTVSSFVSNYDSDKAFDGVNFLAIFKNLEDNLIYYCRKGIWETTNSSTYGETFAIGSGQQDFINEINTELTFHGDIGPPDFNQAISLNYILLARLLGFERISLNTIQKYWGAGFEVIYFDGEKFSKVNDITYVIWRGKYNPENQSVESSPYLVLNYKYIDDILVLSSFDQNEFELRGVLPIYKTPSDIDMTKMPQKVHFDSKKICAIFLIEFPNGKIISPAFFSHASDNPDEFPIMRVYFNEEDKLVVIIESNFQDKINAQCKVIAEQEGIK